MQIYDVLMLVVLVAATIFGMWKGMAWQIASLASLVLSYFVALRFADHLAPKFAGIAPPPLNKFVAMLVIYMVVSFLIWSLFRIVSGVIDRVKLETFDRQMGGIFGFAKGVLLCTAITFFAVSLLPQPQKEQIIASQTGRYIVAMLDKTDAVVPPEIHDVIGPYLHRINEQLDPGGQHHHEHSGQANWPSAAFPEWPSSTPTTGSNPVGQPVSTPTQPTANWPPDSQAAGAGGRQY
ncbi:CvpA family protein [Bythopirellula goksoeyrii]|uniref:Colicin V production protein n=1 Tax=Bythopirellula goksoeyrii TaxID=1400387 RepID=A0A5B9Q896_9BACT|nr:CvpA family protein [Bythopirellula goksoeyrii]QEG33116.1 colicin V production protein [Bythopirellula goksoeyrii]